MKKFVPAVIVTFLLYVFLMWLSYGVLLKADLMSLGSMFRAEIVLPYLLIGHVIFAIGFVYIYGKGAESKPWFGQAVCYSISVWFLVGLSMAFVSYAVSMTPMMFIVKQAVFQLVALFILALPVAYIYRK